MTDEFILDLDDYATRCVINSQFLNLYKEKGHDLTLHRIHHVSSWFTTYPSKGGVKCFSYESIGSGCELVVVYPGSVINLEEMLDHILINNGFALSKDNLFMLPEIPSFKEYLLSVGNKNEAECIIIAPAHKDNLIECQYLYYPCLRFEKQINVFIDEDEKNKFHRQMYLSYVVARVDGQHKPQYLRFAYFRKK